MKKLFLTILCLCMMCTPALAEESAPLVDVTGVAAALGVLLLMIFAVSARVVWVRWVRPWMEANDLMWLTKYADEAVMMAEAFIGRGLGSEKWQYALDKMAEFGFYVDNKAVTDALLAAWKRLDLAQMTAGEKDPPDNDEGGDAVD